MLETPILVTVSKDNRFEEIKMLNGLAWDHQGLPQRQDHKTPDKDTYR